MYYFQEKEIIAKEGVRGQSYHSKNGILLTIKVIGSQMVTQAQLDEDNTTYISSAIF
jgi:hypothetical protein